ncbi:MAG TPA: SMI1/KNR4 family protein [Candidatus Binatia bacterium]|nr:SMI1/KNR4 family protein [Candidatus Binatia bacterium]
MGDIATILNTLLTQEDAPETAIVERENALGKFPADYRHFLKRTGGWRVQFGPHQPQLILLGISSLRMHTFTYDGERDFFYVVPIGVFDNELISYKREAPGKGEIVVLNTRQRDDAVTVAPNFITFLESALESITTRDNPAYWHKPRFKPVQKYERPVIRGKFFHSTTTMPDQMGSCGSVTYKL